MSHRYFESCLEFVTNSCGALEEPISNWIGESYRVGHRSGFYIIGILKTFEIVAGAIVGRVKIGGAYGAMMRGRMVFGKVISFIENALFPVYKKLALADAVMNPIETHVDGFGALLFDTLVGNTSCSAVVSLDRGRWLRMAEFFKINVQWASLFTIEEKGCKLRFGSTGEDFFQNLAVNVDGTVGGWVRIGGQR